MSEENDFVDELGEHLKKKINDPKRRLHIRYLDYVMEQLTELEKMKSNKEQSS